MTWESMLDLQKHCPEDIYNQMQDERQWKLRPIFGVGIELAETNNYIKEKSLWSSGAPIKGEVTRWLLAL